MVATGSQTINFSGDVDDGSINIELDSDFHISLYGEEKTEFNKSEMVYLKVTPTYSNTPYDILTSSGECSIATPDNFEEITEELTFDYESSAELSNTPIDGEPISTEWIAGDDYPILITGKEITTTENVVGILKCTYYRLFDRLGLEVDSSMEDDKVVVVVKNISGKASETVEYTGEGTLLRDVTLVIKDIVSDEVIPNAEVRVKLGRTTIFTGTTNINGKVTIEDLIEGTTYDLRVTATNYLDSDSDYLNNDSFTVPSTTDE